jgi:hypothetical protein
VLNKPIDRKLVLVSVSDPDPLSESGSESRRPKRKGKKQPKDRLFGKKVPVPLYKANKMYTNV